ncbi:MAG: hypothetical protein R3C68_19105 [Myxococcota bacterium]
MPLPCCVRDAATVILMRPSEAAIAEVCMIRRHDKSGFFGGAYVFAGGQLDDADSDTAMLGHFSPSVRQHCAQRLNPTPDRPLSEDQRVGLWVAACRELFEEVGIVLGSGPNLHGLADERSAVHREPQRFAHLHAHGRLRVDLSTLSYWGHWVTPSAEPKRYDTRFFVALAPLGQEPNVDDHEATELGWLTPPQALAQQNAGIINLPPPTLLSLAELARELNQAESLMSWWEGIKRKNVEPILPKVIPQDASIPRTILLPWDPQYAAASGESIQVSAAAAIGLKALCSRLVFADDHWQMVQGE